MLLSKTLNSKRSFTIPRVLVIGALFTSCCVTSVFGQTTGIINGYNVTVKTGPSSNASTIMYLNKGDAVDVESRDGDYYRINVNGSMDLYVGSDSLYLDNLEEASAAGLLNIQTAAAPATGNGQSSSTSPAAQTYAPNNQYALINSSDGLNLRSDPSEEAEIIMALPQGAVVDVETVWDNWVKVHVDNETGYMAKEFLSLQQGTKPVQAESSRGGSQADSLIAYAKQFLGTPYRWAGTNLSKGVDCSGFVYSVYRHFGITLDRTSRSMANDGTRVKRANLQKGDLIFFDTSGSNNGSISHVGIYIGDGQFIQSSSSRKNWGVTISSLNESAYSRQFVTACRILS